MKWKEEEEMWISEVEGRGRMMKGREGDRGGGILRWKEGRKKKGWRVKKKKKERLSFRSGKKME